MYKSCRASSEALLVFSIVMWLFYQVVGFRDVDAGNISIMMLAVSLIVIFVSGLRALWDMRILIATLVLLSAVWFVIQVFLQDFATGAIVISTCGFAAILLTSASAIKHEFEEKNDLWIICISLIPGVGIIFNAVAAFYKWTRNPHTT